MTDEQKVFLVGMLCKMIESLPGHGHTYNAVCELQDANLRSVLKWK